MPGTLAIPNLFTAVTGNQPGSNLDTDLTTIRDYINNREIAFGTLANRPAAANKGNSYFATDVNGGTLYLDNGTAWQQASLGLSQTSSDPTFLGGLALSNDGTSPNTVIDVAIGAAMSDDATIANRVAITLSTAITKSTASWVVGTGNGGMASGAAVAQNTWYHVFLITRTDTGVVDIAFDTSATGANIAANTNAAYTKKRRIGSFKTASASTNILAFAQDGDYFRWSATVMDWDSGDAPGTSAITVTLASVPSGVKVDAYVSAAVRNTGAASTLLLSDLAGADEVPIATGAPALAAPLGHIVNNAATSIVLSPPFNIRTNTSGQIRARFSGGLAGSRGAVETIGWYDRRGRG